MKMSTLKKFALLAEEYVCDEQHIDFMKDVIDIFIECEELKNKKQDKMSFSNIDDDDKPF